MVPYTVYFVHNPKFDLRSPRLVEKYFSSNLIFSVVFKDYDRKKFRLCFFFYIIRNNIWRVQNTNHSYVVPTVYFPNVKSVKVLLA